VAVLVAAGQVAAVLVTTPRRSGYKRTAGFTIREVTGSGGTFLVEVGMIVDDARLRGLDLVLLLALQDGTGQTGLFYPLGLRVAQEGVDGDWDGMRTFCVKAKNFSIRGRKDCRQRKLGKARFFTVDTEKELTWVQNLSD
jgi:hypothetical protein